MLLVESVIPAHDREFPTKWVYLEMLSATPDGNGHPPNTDACCSTRDFT